MKTEPICFIIGAGEHFLPPRVKNPKDLMIAADGGYAYLKSEGIKPDMIIGDFDSLGYTPREPNVTALPPEKDVTDTAAAIKAGWQKGFRTFRIYGGTGGRLDHTLANIQCVAAVAENGGAGYLMGGDCVVTAVHNGEIKFSPKAGGYISVFSHSSLSSGVNEKGLKYSVDGAVLKNSDPLGVSNEFIGEQSLISVRDGTLIIIYPSDAEIACIKNGF